MRILTDFAMGITAGIIISTVLFGVIAGFWFINKRDKELIEYAEKQQEIEAMRENYVNRNSVEFLEVPGVRGAADNAYAEFERNRDEIIQQFRDRLSGGSGYAD